MCTSHRDQLYYFASLANHCKPGLVAQLVEHLPGVQVVVGLSPGVGRVILFLI